MALNVSDEFETVGQRGIVFICYLFRSNIIENDVITIAITKHSSYEYGLLITSETLSVFTPALLSSICLLKTFIPLSPKLDVCLCKSWKYCTNSLSDSISINMQVPNGSVGLTNLYYCMSMGIKDFEYTELRCVL